MVGWLQGGYIVVNLSLYHDTVNFFILIGQELPKDFLLITVVLAIIQIVGLC